MAKQNWLTRPYEVSIPHHGVVTVLVVAANKKAAKKAANAMLKDVKTISDGTKNWQLRLYTKSQTQWKVTPILPV